MGKPLSVLTGRRFGKLTVIEMIGTKGGRSQWRCACDCGGARIVNADKLTQGRTIACSQSCARSTHGHSARDEPTPTYSCWRNMRARCTQPSSPAFAHYKKRGITICARWDSFENFLADMGERPSLKHTIDRWPNNDGNYEPGNCRWATKRQQANNRVTNIWYDYEGQRMTLAQIARASGISKELIRGRLRRGQPGW
jgi:hypothetical protein